MTVPFDLPSRSSSRVRLEPVQPRDTAFVGDLISDIDVAHQFVLAGASATPSDIDAFLWQGVISQFLIVRQRDDDPAGLVQVRSASWRHRHAKIIVVLASNARSSVWPIEGVVLFINYVFESFPLRKLYGEVNEFNARQFGSALSPASGALLKR